MTDDNGSNIEVVLRARNETTRATALTRKLGVSAVFVGLAYSAIHQFAPGTLPDRLSNILFLAVGIAWVYMATETQKRAIKLATHHRSEDVGTLIDALRIPHQSKEAAVVRKKLAQLLPSLTEADAKLITEAQYGELKKHLARIRPNADPALTAAILRTLPLFDRVDTLPAVRRMAEGRGQGRNAGVRCAAEETLPKLEAILTAATRRGSLLVPATAPSNTDMLLRPASGGDSDTDKLLRAVEGTGDES